MFSFARVDVELWTVGLLECKLRERGVSTTTRTLLPSHCKYSYKEHKSSDITAQVDGVFQSRSHYYLRSSKVERTIPQVAVLELSQLIIRVQSRISTSVVISTLKANSHTWLRGKYPKHWSKYGDNSKQQIKKKY